MIKTIELQQAQQGIENGDSLVLNLTADWCSDCTDQALNLTDFAAQLSAKNIVVNSLVMQKEKNIYLSPAHQKMTESLGGHGFPRTVLIINGHAVDADNVEVITSEQLASLATQFLGQL